HRAVVAVMSVEDALRRSLGRQRLSPVYAPVSMTHGRGETATLAERARRRRRLPDARTAVGHGRGRPAVAARKLGLVSDAAMGDAIRKAGVRRLAAEVEVGLAGMADRP